MTDYIPSLSDSSLSGGRLNLYNALNPQAITYTPNKIHVVLDRNTIDTRTLTLYNHTDIPITWNAVSQNPEWLSFDKTSGIINAFSTDNIVFSFDASVPESNPYSHIIHFFTDSTDLPNFDIPITISVRSEYFERWSESIGGPNTENNAGMVKDKQNNLYVFGDFSGNIDLGSQTLSSTSDTDREIFLAKYTKDGQIVWIKQIGNNQNEQTAKKISIDMDDNIYISGYYVESMNIDNLSLNDGTVNKQNIFIAKINSAGDVIWLRGGLIDNYFDGTPWGLAGDGFGNYYLSCERGIDRERQLIKFDTNGNIKWQKKEIIYDIEIDEDNNIVTTGTTLIIKFDQAGNELFRETGVNGVGNDVIIDKNNNIYVTGYYTVSTNPGWSNPIRDILVASYDSNNILNWQKRLNISFFEDIGDSIADDDFGNIYITGRVTTGTNDTYDIYIGKLDSMGNLVYQDIFGYRYENDYAKSIITDNAQNIYFSGTYKLYLIIDESRIYSKGDSDIIISKLKLDKPFPDFSPPANAGRAVYVKDQEYMEVQDNNNDLVFNPNSTIEFWLKPEINPNNYTSQSIFYRGRSDLNDYQLELRYTPLQDYYSQQYNYARLEFSNGHNILRSRKNIPMNKWVHIALTRQDNLLTLYLNGEWIDDFDLGTSEQIPLNPADPLYLGGEVFTTADGIIYVNLYMQGQIDDFRISDSVRDIEQNWADGVYFQHLTADVNTKALWLFENNLNDESSYNNDGAAHGNITYVEGRTPASSTPAPTKPGDVNGDNHVNISDLGILLSNFGSSGSTGDVNGDGRVNISDLGILLSNFGS